MAVDNKTRRTVLRGSAAIIGGTAFPRIATATILTPDATEGPYYPSSSMLTKDTDNDLVKVTGQVREAGGNVLMLTGRVLDNNGNPLGEHRVEIWQCDMNGKYLHTGDKRDITYDEGFQGFGRDITDAEGNYRFRTIIPTQYPGRTPHIHIKVCIGDKELLTTQFYIANHPDNEVDGIYRRMSTEQARAVSMQIDKAGDEFKTNVNIIL